VDNLWKQISTGEKCAAGETYGQIARDWVTGVGVSTMIRKIKETAVNLWNDERGASLLEYSILIGLITAGVVGLITGVGGWVSGKWTALSTALGIS
jgi:pilus assembly protein Flp/PilA